MPPLTICIDEAGRGPLAGPVSVGLCSITPSIMLEQIQPGLIPLCRDSKALTPKRRQTAYDTIIASPSLTTAYAQISASQIDTHGIIHALRTSICRGLVVFLSRLGYIALETPPSRYPITMLRHDLHTLTNQQTPITLLIDGNHDFRLRDYLKIDVQTMIQGDAHDRRISAASIIAKVTRDAYMTRQHHRYPLYGFALHKGYGTAHHRQMIATHGLCPLHRRTYCHNLS